MISRCYSILAPNGKLIMVGQPKFDQDVKFVNFSKNFSDRLNFSILSNCCETESLELQKGSCVQNITERLDEVTKRKRGWRRTKLSDDWINFTQHTFFF